LWVWYGSSSYFDIFLIQVNSCSFICNNSVSRKQLHIYTVGVYKSCPVIRSEVTEILNFGILHFTLNKICTWNTKTCVSRTIYIFVYFICFFVITILSLFYVYVIKNDWRAVLVASDCCCGPDWIVLMWMPPLLLTVCVVSPSASYSGGTKFKYWQ
jgi:hypothetical protein